MINTLFACGKSKHKPKKWKFLREWHGPLLFFYGNSHGKQEWHQQKYVFKHIRALASVCFISVGYCLFDKVSFYWEKKERKKKRDLRIYLMHVSTVCVHVKLILCLFVLFSSFSLLSSSRPAHHCVFLLASYCLIVKILQWCDILVFNFWNMQSSKANS